MKDSNAFELALKKQLVTKQMALQALGEIHSQIKQTEARLYMLSGYQKEYTQDLEKAFKKGTKVGDIHYFLKFMEHLNKVMDDSKVYMTDLLNHKNQLHSNYAHSKQACDTLLQTIEKMKLDFAMADKKLEENMLQDLYLQKRG